MKKTASLLCIFLGLFMLYGCTDWADWMEDGGNRTAPRCESLSGFGGGLQDAYEKASANACMTFLEPYDQSIWWEAKLNSRRVRNQEVLRVGCTHCPDGNRDCESLSNCGGCGSADLKFDFTRIMEDAEIVTAKLAVNAVENVERLDKAIVEGRYNIGGDFGVISQNPTIKGNWVFFDITNFVCRAVVDRRNSSTITISLPCGPQRRSKIVSVVASDGLSPQVILEYR